MNKIYREAADWGSGGNTEKLTAAKQYIVSHWPQSTWETIGLSDLETMLEEYLQQGLSSAGNTGPWKVVTHCHQIADTGDYGDLIHEITDGKNSFFSKDEVHNAQEYFAPLISALNGIEDFQPDHDKIFYEGYDKGYKQRNVELSSAGREWREWTADEIRAAFNEQYAKGGIYPFDAKCGWEAAFKWLQSQPAVKAPEAGVSKAWVSTKTPPKEYGTYEILHKGVPVKAYYELFYRWRIIYNDEYVKPEYWKPLPSTPEQPKL